MGGGVEKPALCRGAVRAVDEDCARALGAHGALCCAGDQERVVIEIGGVELDAARRAGRMRGAR